MKLSNEMVVPAPLEDAWPVLLDVERVAPCLPGAEITAVDGDDYRGRMTVKLGPIISRFEGSLRIEDADEADRRAVLVAKAREARGQGDVRATISSTMESTPEGTRVRVETELRVSGPAAQFGRGVMQDVSAKLMDRFADCLAAEIRRARIGPRPAPAGAPGRAASVPTARALPADIPRPPGVEAPREAPAAAPGVGAAGEAPPREEVLDLGAIGREAVLRRALPLAVAATAVLALLVLRRRRR